MSLSKAFAAGCAIGFSLCVSFSGQAIAQSPEQSVSPFSQVGTIWSRLAPEQRKMVDLLAEDFFQNELSDVQQNRIVTNQGRKYRDGEAPTRDQIRASRRAEWQAKSQAEKARARLSSGGAYNLLTAEQKAPFRLYAIDQLDLKPALHVDRTSRDSAV
ncbi:hypothetical protein [Parvularcula sp. IMCC14364]|uniref:hypothetical protein n=1 Tax=Parvularcula sp. IMCC14364 TaxID=3067902 RepID=UPI0027404354|nr:hypothetical protein [Parvularcula sp. IMCC14364]